MGKPTLYFHYPCFDGLVSAVLAWEFLESHETWQITDFEPVDYTLRDTWLSTELQNPAAVVDFLYHPQAQFWADHHQTSILSAAAKIDFELRKREPGILFDARAKSCASLLFRSLRRFLGHKPHFKDMVAWAQKIDSAKYSSVKEAILGDAPALRIARTLSADDDAGRDYARFLMPRMRDHDLAYVADLKEVKDREDRIRRSILSGLESVKAKLRLEKGGVAVFDARPKRDQVISRYAPYYFQPHARYSIAVVRSEAGIRITAMRNPWRNFRSIPLGKTFAKFGGGGHERVGALQLPPSRRSRVGDVVRSLISEMQHRSR
jgi:AcrR family transcriptional regulator